MIALVLRHRFIIQPVLLSSVVKPFSGYEQVYRLFALVMDYIPEERETLLKLAPIDAAGEFTKLFSKRYFPVGNTMFYDKDFCLKQLVESAPVDWHGMRERDYEPTRNIYRAQLLAETICTCPFEGVRNDRIAVLTEFTKRVGDDAAELLIKFLPSRGCAIENVEEALKDSPYPGLLAWCRWVFAKTGNRWLDNSSGNVSWDREEVELLSRDWKTYLEIDKEMKKFDIWLSNSLPARAAEVIQYVAQKIGKTLMEVFADGNHDNQSDEGGGDEQERDPFAF